MNNWKKITLAAIMITVAGFTYIKSSHRDIPSDLRDAINFDSGNIELPEVGEFKALVQKSC